MEKRQKKSPSERVLQILQTGNMFSFKELAAKSGLSKAELDQTLHELRQIYPNIRFLKFSKMYQLDRTPTPYFFQHDFSKILPEEGVIGLISDTHLGSIAERLDILEFAYSTYQEAGVAHVFHSGDLTDGNGNVYPGHQNHIHCLGDDQLVWCMKKYPKRDGIMTHFIAGNHDLKSFQKSGVDPMDKIVQGFEHRGRPVKGRSDMHYLGQMATQILLPQEVVMDLIHPDGGSVYAKSYKVQKRSEAMSRETRPDIQVSGHYHDFVHLWIDGTAFLAMPGCQDATEFFRRRGFSRQVGFIVLYYKIQKGKLVYANPRLYMFG